MKIKNVKIYCNPQAQCPAFLFINKLDMMGQIQFFHKLATVRLGIYSECIRIDENVCAIRFHERNKEMVFYFGIGQSANVLLTAGMASHHEMDSKKALLYWKDYKRSDFSYTYLSFTEEFYAKLHDKKFAIEYLKSTIVDPEKKVFIVALKDVLQSQSIDHAEIKNKRKLNIANLTRLIMKKNAAEVLMLQDILTALGLYLSVRPIKQ